MDPVGDSGWEFTIKLFPSSGFGLLDIPNRHIGNCLVWTWTRTWCDSPELLLTLAVQQGEPIFNVSAASVGKTASDDNATTS